MPPEAPQHLEVPNHRRSSNSRRSSDNSKSGSRHHDVSLEREGSKIGHSDRESSHSQRQSKMTQQEGTRSPAASSVPFEAPVNQTSERETLDRLARGSNELLNSLKNGINSLRSGGHPVTPQSTLPENVEILSSLPVSQKGSLRSGTSTPKSTTLKSQPPITTFVNELPSSLPTTPGHSQRSREPGSKEQASKSLKTEPTGSLPAAPKNSLRSNQPSSKGQTPKSGVSATKSNTLKSHLPSLSANLETIPSVPATPKNSLRSDQLLPKEELSRPSAKTSSGIATPFRSPRGSLQPEPTSFSAGSMQVPPNTPQQTLGKITENVTPRSAGTPRETLEPSSYEASTPKSVPRSQHQSPNASGSSPPRPAALKSSQVSIANASISSTTNVAALSSKKSSPKMWRGESTPTTVSAKNSFNDGTTPKPLMNTDTLPAVKRLSEDSMAGFDPMEPFVLSVAGICDANDQSYFPLQERIAYLESKLIDLTIQHQALEHEHRLVKQSHKRLDENIKNANLMARDQVVFENLRFNYELVSTELQEARQLIKELRQLGWENLPQRILYECKRAHEYSEEMRRQRDIALHEHSAAKGIAVEALKQVQVLKRSIEDHKKLADNLVRREVEIKERYIRSLEQVNLEWEQKLFTRHVRDNRRQKHLLYMLEEERDLAEDRDPQELEDIRFRAHLVFRYPTLAECMEDATAIGGNDLGVPAEPGHDKIWHISSKISHAERPVSEMARSTTASKRTTVPRAFSRLGRFSGRPTLDIGESTSTIWGDETEHRVEIPVTDAERLAWEHVRTQMNQKLREKEEEVAKWRKLAKDLESELEELKQKTLTEVQMEEEIRALNEENAILVEHYLAEMVLRKKYLNVIQDLRGKIRVFCRIRPAVLTEVTRKNPIVLYTPDKHTALVKVSKGLKVFQFDRVFGSNATQEDLFEETTNLVQSVIDGYNVCIFAYGETGSGKTYTLAGDRQHPGLVFHCVDYLFELLDDPLFRTKSYSDVSVSIMEMYDEKILDLLVDYGAHEDLPIKPDNNGVMYVEGVVQKQTACAAELYELYQRAWHNRRMAETRLEHNSTRSHFILSIMVMVTNKITNTTYRGKLTAIDMAGSERATTGSTGESLKDTDQSLVALGDVITSLTLSQPTIPYESSKLTKLMQDSLGGNAKTLMIITVNETEAKMAETINSLNYGSRLKTVDNQANPTSNSEQVAKLRVTTEKLKKGEPEPC
ncbi:hypothetical protein CRM22_008782 [Opisthorchis felineus]|uniref:Kinesin motor domain-containing protein n=1 Tax=Opisthorchis felineus TaxID=147828 RepID=A0A4S2LBN3_OPIFE|nr:hypothetical protein CRM22_008782 [Opisthorchis felineus]